MESRQELSSARVVLYRYGDGVYRQRWYARRVGLFGSMLVLVMTGGLLGLTWHQRVALLGNAGNTYANAVAHDDQSNLVQQAAADRGLADNIVDLQPLLNDWVAQHPGQQWGVVVKSVNGPSFEARINDTGSYSSSSSANVYLLAALKDSVPYDTWRKKRVTVDHKSKTVSECVDAMLGSNSPSCTSALADLAGWDKVSSALSSAGLSKTTMGQSPTMRKTTAGDAANYLLKLDSDLLPEKMRDQVLQAMAKQPVRKGIPAGCPGCVVQDDTGTDEDTIHDMGVISYSRGRYVLVIAAQGTQSYADVANLSGKIQQRILDEIN